MIMLQGSQFSSPESGDLGKCLCTQFGGSNGFVLVDVEGFGFEGVAVADISIYFE